MTDSTVADTTPAGTPEGARRASPYPDLLYSRLDQAGIAACRSRMATMLRLMQAMTFDTTRSVRRTVTPGQSAIARLDRPVMIGTVELLPVHVGGMEARVEISVVPENGWLTMEITASCPPMLGRTVVRETIREDLVVRRIRLTHPPPLHRVRTMEVRTARHKLSPSRAQYALLRDVRGHCMRLRNACLQELKDSYRAARRAAARHGRDRPSCEDWIEVRREEIADFMAWQAMKEPDLRRRHAQAEDRRITKLRDRIAHGDPKADPADLAPRPWRPKDASSFGRGISKADQMRRLAEIRKSDPEGIGSVPLSILRDQIETVHRAMDAFFERVKSGQKAGFPRFKSYERVRSIACPIGDGIQLKQETPSGRATLHAPMLWHGGVDVPMHRDLPGAPTTIRLTYDGRFWWTTIACEVESVEAGAHPRAGTAIGIDAGVRRLLTFDDGSFVENPKFLEADAPEIRRLSRKLSRAKRGSHGRAKAKRALARARAATANRRRTHHHRVALDVARRAETVFVEDLKVRNMTRSAAGTADEPGVNVAAKRGLNRGMLDAAISTLHGMIRYKAASAGGRVVCVDPRNTSTDCSECGGREPGARRQERYRCSCGAELDADHNAARNVPLRGLLAA